MDHEIVIPLKDASDVELVGGKAASLGRMMREGFNIPAGFVITTESDNLMTDSRESKILEKFDGLGAKLVAVRSSAAAEDSQAATWAGQFDTYLNVNRENLLESVKKCWKSVGSDRAKAYGQEKNLQSGPVAVIVQKMVDANISGVAFSVHPVTKNPQYMAVEATIGLGEVLVSGKITPDSYTIDKQTSKVTEKKLVSEKAILNESQIKQLTEEVNKLERLFGFPVDIEWSFAGDELLILQSRPITTLK